MEERAVCDAVESFIERQQQVIDLLMKAVEPFADEGSLMFSTWSDDEKYLGQLTVGNFRRAREAKVEAEKILNSTPSTAL